jgi:arsenite methyltransferase
MPNRPAIHGEAIAGVLTPEEQQRLDAYMRELVEAATPTRRTLAMAFLRGERP